jgi:hypothetical protein
MARFDSGKTWRVLLVLCGVAVGYAIGQSQNGTDLARAEVRETAQRSTFLAGSERSEAVLRDISSTLKTMDRRLERIEKIVGEKKIP